MHILSVHELARVVGGAEMKPTGSGIIQSRPLQGGGVEIDWNKQNQHINSSPLGGPYQFNGGDGSNGQGGWAVG
jgi:hypothetical protein